MSAYTLCERLSDGSATVLPVLIDAAIKGAAVLLLTALATLAMRRASAAARHLVWFLGTLGLLAMPILSAALPAWHILPRWEITRAPSPAAPSPAPMALARVVPAVPELPSALPPHQFLTDETPSRAALPPMPSPVSLPVLRAPAAPPAVALPRAYLTWQAWIFLAWLTGAALLLAYVALGFVSLWLLQRRSSRIAGGPWLSLVRQLNGQLGFRRAVDLRSSPHRTMPMTWGILRTRVLLPADAAFGEPAELGGAQRANGALDGPAEPARGKAAKSARGEPAQSARGEAAESARGEPAQSARGEPAQSARGEPVEPAHGEPAGSAHGELAEPTHGEPAEPDWTLDQHRAVLLHELAHAKRRDCLTQLIVRIACALYWFNPLVWLAWSRMQSEREQACDDLVLRSGARASAYAAQLLRIATEMPAVRFSGAAIAMARPSKLEGRLRAILDATRNRRSLTPSRVLIAVVAALALVIPLACINSSQKDMFTEATIRVPADGGYNWGKTRTLHITDRAQLESLMAFFPQLGRTSYTSSGWISGAQIELKKRDGTVVDVGVSVNDDLQTWSAGRGDWPVKGDLKEFLAKLERGADAANKSAELATVATQPALESAPGSGPWRIRLPCGATVELVGVSWSLSQSWWRPDGTPLQNPPTYLARDMSVLDFPGSQFAIVLSGVPWKHATLDYKTIVQLDVNRPPWPGTAGVAGEWGLPSTDTSDSLVPPRLYGYVRLLPPTQQQSTIRFGVSGGPWAVVANESSVPAETSVHVDRGNFDVVFAPAYEEPSTWNYTDQSKQRRDVFVTIAHNVPPDQQLRVVAVLTDGTEVGGNQAWVSDGRVQQARAEFEDLTLKDIKAFRLESRPFQWAEFKDISLRPAVATHPATHAAADSSRSRAFAADPAAVATHPATHAAADGAGAWSAPINGLCARLVLARDHSLNGTAILTTHLELRNVADPPVPLRVPLTRKLTFGVVDAGAKALARNLGSYDGPAPDPRDLLIPPGKEVPEDLTCSGLGVSGDQAALIDLGAEDNWVIARADGEYFLRAVLEAQPGPAGDAAARTWQGRIELPPAPIPLKAAPLDPATAAVRIDELGRTMTGPPSEAAGRAAHALSLIDDPRVVPWYVKAIQSDNSGRKAAALDRLGRFNGHEALAGLEIGMRTRGADIANATTPQMAEWSADQIRWDAALALMRSPHPRAKALLLTMWNDRFAPVRSTVVCALAGAKDRASVDLLKKMAADDADATVGAQAAEALRAAAAHPATRPAASGAADGNADRLPAVAEPAVTAASGRVRRVQPMDPYATIARWQIADVVDGEKEASLAAETAGIAPAASRPVTRPAGNATPSHVDQTPQPGQPPATAMQHAVAPAAAP